MPIQVACACGKKLSVKDELAGRRVKCPACQQTISVPKPKVQADSTDDEWDLGDSAADDFDEERPMDSKRSSGGKKSASRGQASKKGKSKGKSSSGENRGLLIGLSAGGGLLVIALLAWMLWPTKPVPAVAVAPNNNVGNPSNTSGESASSTTTTGVAPGSPPSVTTTSPSVPATASTPKLEGDLNLLQGTWQVAEVGVDPDQPGAANMVASVKQIAWTIKGDILTMSRPDGDMASTMKLDTAQTPKALDLIPLEEGGRKTGLAIYSLEGDSWKLCMTNAGDTRPKEMKPDKALGQMVLTLKRGSPAASDKPTAVASGAQFDHKAWQQASDKLKAMKVFSIMDRCEPNNPSFPDGLTHYAVIDPLVNADGKIPLGLWAVMSKVSHLVVRTTSISDATVQQLSHHPGLVGLNISGRSTVTAAGIAELKKCPNLRSLHLSGVPVSQELLNAISQLGELRAFGINDAQVSGEMVGSIVRLEKLESLSLQNAGITDDDLAQIAKLTNLRSLLLSKSKVTDKGLQSLNGLKLRSLFLDETKVTDQGLQSLKSLTELTMLSVRGLGLSPQALAEFEAAVPKCRVLK